MCYIHSTKHRRMTAYVGDSLADLRLRLFVDADYSGCPKTKRSTSGVFFAVQGPNTFAALSAVSKRQRSVSTSTTEAEVVAAFMGMCQIGVPAMSLWSYILGRTPVIRLCEDNQAAMRIIETGKSPALAHLSRTQGVYMGWLSERFREDCYAIDNVDTTEQAADAMTKPFLDAAKWEGLLLRLGLLDPAEFWAPRETKTPASGEGDPASLGGGGQQNFPALRATP